MWRDGAFECGKGELSAKSNGQDCPHRGERRHHRMLVPEFVIIEDRRRRSWFANRMDVAELNRLIPSSANLPSRPWLIAESDHVEIHV